MAAFTQPGQAEAVKGAVHGSVMTLALMCGVYNFYAWLSRRETHSLVNAGVYGGIVVFEGLQVYRHYTHEGEIV